MGLDDVQWPLAAVSCGHRAKGNILTTRKSKYTSLVTQNSERHFPRAIWHRVCVSEDDMKLEAKSAKSSLVALGKRRNAASMLKLRVRSISLVVYYDRRNQRVYDKIGVSP